MSILRMSDLDLAGKRVGVVGVGATAGLTIGGWVAGVVGAVLGTYGGAEVRSRMAAAFGQDRPAALIEDAVAILGAILIIGAVA